MWLLRRRRFVDRITCIASAGVLVILVLLTFSQARDGITPQVALWRDFGQDYLMARALVDGVDPYVPVRVLAERYLEPTGFLARATPAPHPPSMALLVLPLLALDYTNAVRTWFVLQVTALLVGIYLTLRCVGAPWSARLTPVVTLMLFAWAAVGLDVGLGQSTTILLALLGGAQCAVCSRRPRLAGLLLGISMLIKPLAWPLLLVVAIRRMWSAEVTAVLVALIGWILPAVRLGVAPVLSYFTSVLPTASATYGTEITNLSWWTVGPRFFEGTAAFGTSVPPVLQAPAAAQVVGAGLPVITLALATVWLLKARPDALSAFGVMTGLALLINPISWAYYYGLMVLPTAQLSCTLARHHWPLALTGLGIGSLALLVPLEGQLADVARELSSDRVLAPLPTLITLVPSLGVLGITALLASQAVAGGPRQR